MNGRTVRDSSLDALRAALTALVVFHHAAITYGGGGGWYYQETAPRSAPLLDLFTAVNQSYFMGLFFLIAGYLTPVSFEKRGARGFLRERLVRLGVPLAVYYFALSPLTIALAVIAKGHSFWGTLAYVYARAGMDDGPLWFAFALLIFAAAYALLGRRIPAARAFPSNRALLFAALGVGAAGFASRLIWPIGSTVLSLQLGFFPSYIVLFAAGCAAAAWPTLDAAPQARRRLWRRISWAALPVLPLAVVLGRHFAAFSGPPAGGFSLIALIYAFWEPFLAWGVIMALLHGFHERFATLGPIGSRLSRRAFAIFIVHPPILVGVAVAWRGVEAPALVKFAVTGALAYALCYLVAGGLLRFAPLRRIL